MDKLRSSFRQLGITRGDLILLTGLLAFSGILGLILALRQPEPEYVSVRVDGTEVALLPLDNDCVYRISDGNTIEISGSIVRMTYADCPDKICVKTGAISQSGHSIVCAPHKVVVLITGGNDRRSYDAITN